MGENLSEELLEKVRVVFREELQKNKELQSMAQKLEDKSASYRDAYRVAEIIAEALSVAYNLAFDDLEQMSAEIAKLVVGQTMHDVHNYVSTYAENVQTVLNNKAGLGLKAKRVELNEDRVYGIMKRLVGAEEYSSIKWILGAPIATFAKAIIDESIKQNAEFHANAGLVVVIVRVQTGKCCPWCMAIAGKYSYSDYIPKDIYRRHNTCRCIIDYKPQRR